MKTIWKRASEIKAGDRVDTSEHPVTSVEIVGGNVVQFVKSLGTTFINRANEIVKVYVKDDEGKGE